MTLTTFIKELKALRGKYKTRYYGRIRASEQVGYCPIVGLARLKGYSGDHYAECATFLGLGELIRDHIIMAADNYGNPQLRKRLLATLALKEVV